VLVTVNKEEDWKVLCNSFAFKKQQQQNEMQKPQPVLYTGTPIYAS
jgi:hypothetical protein